VTVGERLAPVGHREAGVQPLRLAKGVGGLHVLEAVEQRDAAEERRPGTRRSRRREIDDAELRRRPMAAMGFLLCSHGGRREGEEDRDQARMQTGSHRVLGLECEEHPD
jgi:hypothetical protein